MEISVDKIKITMGEESLTLSYEDWIKLRDFLNSKFPCPAPYVYYSIGSSSGVNYGKYGDATWTYTTTSKGDENSGDDAPVESTI